MLNGVQGFIKRLLGGPRSFAGVKVSTIHCDNGGFKFVSVKELTPQTLAAIVAEISRGYESVHVLAPGRALKRYVESSLENFKLGAPLSFPPLYPSGSRRLRVVLAPEVSLRSSISGEDVEGLRERVLEALSKTACAEDTIVVSGLSLEGPEAYMGLELSESSLDREFIEVLTGEFIEAFKSLWPGLEPSEVQKAAFKLLSVMAVEGGTLVVLAPTGSGKSAIFQVASRVLASNGLGCYTLIVSPLRALMRDQVYRVSVRGLKAFYVDSSVPPSGRKLVFEAVKECLVDMLYVAPERFFSPEFRGLLEDKPPALIVLDEAHTMAEWGLSFRPSYLYMAGVLAGYRARRGFKPPVIALSATLTRPDLESVLKALGHREAPLELEDNVEGNIEIKASKPVVLKSGVLRHNIIFRVIPAPTGYERLKVLLDTVEKLVEWSRSLEAPWVGLVYTGFVESNSVEWARVDEVVKALKNALDTPVYAYHGKMSHTRRRKVEELFTRGSLREAVMVTTKAFGMGVDAKNIRWTIHYYISDSIEELYQEVGRAGRDGGDALAFILYNPRDVEVKLELARKSRPRPSFILRVLNTIAAIKGTLPQDRGPIIIPLEVFKYKSVAVRALNSLREEGLIDFHIIQKGSLRVEREPRGEHYMWLGGSNYVNIVEEGKGNINLGACSGTPLFNAITLRKGGEPLLETGKCPGGWKFVNHSPMALVEVNSKHFKIEEFLPPNLYINTLRAWKIEVEKLRIIGETLEEAIAKGDPQALDAHLKAKIKEYFEKKSDREPRREIFRILGKKLECETAKCYNIATETLETLNSNFGEEAVVIVTSRTQDIEELAETYRKLIGEIPKNKVVSATQLINTIAKGGWEKLMDKGFIIAFLDKHSKTTKRIEEVLKGYPYHIAIIKN